MDAHTQTFLPRESGRQIVPPTEGVQPLSLSFRTKSLTLLYLHTCLTPWSVFQDGEKKTILSTSRAQVTSLDPAKHTLKGADTQLVGHLTNQHLHTAKSTLTPSRLQGSGCKQPKKYNPLSHSFSSLPFQQFQVLFNSLFKVLCIFPSRYLFAIGLPPIFSLRWNLPPIRAAIPNNSTHRKHLPELTAPKHKRECHPLSCPVPRDFAQGHGRRHFSRPQFSTTC